jgi:PTS system galactitol-specific IIA component
VIRDFTQLLDVAHVRLGVVAPDWMHTLEALASMFRADEVTDAFGRALVEREEKYPTGLPVQPVGVAIPHADPEFVRRPRLAVMTLARPVNFREMGHPSRWVPVQLVIGIALPEADKEQQMDGLSWILGKIQDAQWVEQAVQAPDATALLSLMQ